ncbi:MAG: alpha/beta fold hydrolase [Actinomycetota bacterium]|jgi:haloalkane dehalogenase|nr:alpha/beta fold hydrolase [Acidimicrobiales bacterium]MED5230455.1 alpha/beta fold hydrolase [Actinomycetota bacterium]|tara:strand:- start:1426 stop:2340 length:915 start_codon:yes stop_codon:yes gene_type:complete
MIPQNETFNGSWNYEPKFCTESGFRQHYVDEGEGEVVVCLHGEPTWGYLYRNMIDPLAEEFRVVVPDHMGFGKSETPQDRDYTLKSHTENLSRLIESLDLDNITFVMQDWGGPIGTAYTVRNPERVSRLVYMNTLAGYGRVPDDIQKIQDSRWFKWIGEGLENGRTEAVLRNAGSTVVSIMKLLGVSSKVIDQTWIEAYSSPFPDYESSIGAYEFPIDAYLGRIGEYVLEGLQGVEDLTSKPAILLEGLEDYAIPPEFAMADFMSLWPSSPVIKLPGVGHFCQEDAPEILVASILQFLKNNPIK